MLSSIRKLKKWKRLILTPVALLAQPCLAENSGFDLAIAHFWAVKTREELRVLTTERIAISMKSMFTSRGSFQFVFGSMCACSLLWEVMFRCSMTS